MAGGGSFGGDYARFGDDGFVNHRTVDAYHDNYWHAPVYHGAWYAGAAGKLPEGAVGAAAARSYYNNY